MLCIHPQISIASTRTAPWRHQNILFWAKLLLEASNFIDAKEQTASIEKQAVTAEASAFEGTKKSLFKPKVAALFLKEKMYIY